MMVAGKAPLFVMVAEGIMFSTVVFFVERENPFLAGVGYGTAINLSYIGVYYFMVLLAMV
ncbi:MAG: hypothetical protein SXQ77_08390 [Halobacteria archaeon]|nr:hypothetical protein [Halobacteria archaeon]